VGSQGEKKIRWKKEEIGGKKEERREKSKIGRKRIGSGKQ
jgi:hypothetical protein